MLGVIHAGRPPIRSDAHVFVSKHGGDVTAYPRLYATCADPVRVLSWLMTADRLPSWVSNRHRSTAAMRCLE